MNNDNNIFFVTEKDLKRAQFKARVREKFDGFVRFVDNNKEFVILVGIPAITGLFRAGKSITRTASRNHTIRLEERNKDMRCYDPRLGHYWELKRKLTNDEWRFIDRRRKKGERLSDILSDLNVLK